ncbi:sulfite exporter TauE/SafE family protein [Leuconostocaceae bacterium ESL0958]|nr:sulfite exporter TauE/SafE family protein [Leuconostocaceae bacterium ESL0958]
MMAILYGFLIGCFVTVIGGGGTTFYLGVLTASLGLSTAEAVPTSLFIAVFALFSGFITQLRLKNVAIKTGNQLIIAAIPGIFIGTAVAKYIPEQIYRIAVGLLLVLMGGLVLAKFFRRQKKTVNPDRSRRLATLFGLLSGLMVGFGGLSGGSATVAGLSIMGVPAVLAAGTTTYVLWVLAVVGFISHLFTSSVNWSAGLLLMVGGIAGSIFMPLVLARFNPQKLNRYLPLLMGGTIVYFGLNLLL